MKTITQALATASSRSTHKSTPRSLEPQHEKLLLALWKRMTQLYGHKWSSQHALYDSEADKAAGCYSEDFMLWAKKTQDLSEMAWRRGMNYVEYRNQEAAQQGEFDSWPPNYAEFVGMCIPIPGSQIFRAFEPKKLPDQSAQERSKVVGRQTLDSLKSLFTEAAE
ncbi:hypothetical protein [uncultured Microbulbifer sp.]|uniref:hypothetical protein n=1 Tax=uncultured Microbulbifer sp. TaxID=348147 RepID=UPI002603AF39|nr:hypothetical protein [uncultured Microbulbifer sp.]